MLKQYYRHIINNMSITSKIEECIQNNNELSSFYLIDLGKIIELYSYWNFLLPNIKPYYAVKSNNNIRLIEKLNDLGVNFDCASKTEIQQILDITNDPNRIIFANPCKIPDHIQYANEKSVDLMTFDCEEELYKIKRYYPTARLVLRLAVDDSKSKMKFSKKFGCYINNVKELLILSKTLDLNVVGFSFHVGSKCMCTMAYYYAIKYCKEAYEIATGMGINIHIIDIGGGFSVLHDFEKTSININKAICDFFSEELHNGTIQFISEPGRYFSETSHTLVLQIIGKKQITENENKNFSYTVNESIYNSFNCIIFDCCIPDFNILKPKTTCNNKYRTNIFGYTCDSMDLLLEEAMMHEMMVGDWVYIENFGAYSYSASSTFNGFHGTQNFIYL